MANASTSLLLLGVGAVGCFGSAQPTRALQAQPVIAKPAPQEWSGCGSPGRERCDAEPANLQVLADNLRLACAEDCSKHWMESSGVVAASDGPLDTRRAELARVESRLLDCFARCDQRQAELAMANMPPGVEPCTEGGSSPNDSACLEYACQRYGDKKYMLPSAARPGEACEVPSSKQPGTCLAGSCVPSSGHVEACSAFAIRATAIDWLRVFDGDRRCQLRGGAPSCFPRPLGLASRASLLDWLSCEAIHGELTPPAVPWGHWPISLTGGAK